MPLTALKPQVKEIPPDLAAVLGDAPIHPELLHATPRPTPPTAATLGVIHSVGKGGVLHLRPSTTTRAVSLVRGTLVQRNSKRPSLRPGTVRLVPVGRSLTLADLAWEGALAVEVVF
jgi:hypothetical protein